MAQIDTWTDETVERALRLLRIGNAIVWELMRTAKMDRGIRPSTVDRWILDSSSFLMQHTPEGGADFRQLTVEGKVHAATEAN
jgi:hypothetical protein